MKKMMSFLILAAIVISPLAFAMDDMEKSAPMGGMDKSGMMKMYQCPMDGYTSDKPGKCKKCGMDLAEKEMTADEAKKAVESSGESK